MGVRSRDSSGWVPAPQGTCSHRSWGVCHPTREYPGPAPRPLTTGTPASGREQGGPPPPESLSGRALCMDNWVMGDLAGSPRGVACLTPVPLLFSIVAQVASTLSQSLVPKLPPTHCQVGWLGHGPLTAGPAPARAPPRPALGEPVCLAASSHSCGDIPGT